MKHDECLQWYQAELEKAYKLAKDPTISVWTSAPMFSKMRGILDTFKFLNILTYAEYKQLCDELQELWNSQIIN